MKIIAIRIKNLASLEGITEIDFTAEPLKSAGIFAITGATGAGKSTILDALCLALYGKTPRYLQAKEIGIEIHDVQGSTMSQGDVRGILRDGTADGYAEVEFIGTDGQQYRSTWSVRRARNKAEGSMQADSITLENSTSNTPIPGKKAETYKEIERLIGLNFEQFTRSVLLAQGDFTAFLRANKDEKSSLLEKLTGTYIYSEISKKIYEKYKQEEQQLRELNLQKEGITTFTDEELITQKEALAVLEEQIIIFEKEATGLANEINWHEQLIQIQTSYEAATTALQQATQEKTKAAARNLKLLQAEQAQKTRSWFDAFQQAQKQQTEKKIALATLEVTIAGLLKQKEVLDTQLLSSEINLTAKNKSLTEALPQLEEAKKLDTLLSEKKEQLAKVKEEAENTSTKSKNHQKIVGEQQLALTTLLTDIKIIENWKTENKDRSPLAENKDIILSKLQDAQKLLETVQFSKKELEGVENKIKSKEIEKTNLETKLGTQQKEWEGLKKTFDSKSKELLLIPIEKLNLDKDQTELSVQNTIQASANWDSLFNLLNNYEALDKKQIQDQSDFRTKEETLKQISERLITEKAVKEASSQLLQKARLAASENVEKLRAELVDNEACAVCGSEDHPYAAHNPQLENVLTALEMAHQTNETAYDSYLKQHSSIEQECSTFEKTIGSQQEDLGTKKSLLEFKRQEWKKFAISKECQEITNEQKVDWLAEKLEKLKKTQTDLQKQIQTHTSQKQQLEIDKTRLDLLKEMIDNLNNQLKEDKNALVLFAEQQTNRKNEQEKATVSLIEVEELLTPYFINADWMENWKVEPVLFLEKITNFTQKWKTNSDKREQSYRQQGILEARLSELKSQEKSFLAEALQKTEAYYMQDKDYSSLQKQRTAIFNGIEIQEIEKQLKDAIINAQDQVEKNKQQNQQLSIESAEANINKKRLLESLETINKTATTSFQKMIDWLEGYNQKQSQNLSITQLQELLLLSNDWIETEQNSLKIIDDEVTKITAILAERTQQLEAHKLKSASNHLLEDLKLLHVATKFELEKKKQIKGEITFQLQLDATNKNKIGDLLKSIHIQLAISENWSKLNDIIGSADGKKFRQIAQEYTLDVLLGYANIHLEVLTNRYKIQRIPGSLGLQVIDQDMGNEIRTVYSLSGGESFLVSLALALGLSSLTSSRMKVESLFIDEGFGSLDPTTLNIAMDALERLHNQGRKVGVISHVQEMTERIPTQINVSKMASGKSKVAIYGM
ncbi:AAA family ATPase [Flavobacterium ovatum]|uniref:AAA family ATPase n=1 Tax=Flavobacterium ovatum TaxID=1928857 RepID=UPI00344E9572